MRFGHRSSCYTIQYAAAAEQQKRERERKEEEDRKEEKEGDVVSNASH